MIAQAVASILGGAATKKAAMRLAELRAERGAVAEPYDRSERKDFWNDPERWEGIEDPRKTMIWEVRRRDVIDVRPDVMAVYNPYLNAANQHPYALAPLLEQSVHFRSGGALGERTRL